LRRTITPLLLFLIALGTAAGLYAAWRRYSVEQKNRRVEIAMDYGEIHTLAQMKGIPTEEALRRFKAAGATSIAVTEDTLGALESEGSLRVSVRAGGTSVEASPRLFLRIRANLDAKGLKPALGAGAYHLTTFAIASGDGAEHAPDSGDVTEYALAVDWPTLRSAGVGLDPVAIGTVQRAGLVPVGRIANFTAASPATMAATLDLLTKDGVRTVIFQGTEVFGFRGLGKQAAEVFQRSGLQYGSVEFGKQKGDEELGRILKGDFIRVHSVSDAEMSSLSEMDAIDRFVRAARERNIRLNFVRLFTTTGDDPIQANVDYIEKIARRTARSGEFEFGTAHGFGETGVPALVFAVIGLGVAAGATLLLIRLAPVSDGAAWAALIVLAAGCAGAALVLGETGRKLVALLAALVFPILACIRRDVLGGDESRDVPPVSTGAAALKAVHGIAAASAVTGLGIVAMVGLLATRPFIVKANQFMGIKAAHAIPILLIALLTVTGLPRLDRSWMDSLAEVRNRVRSFFAEPMRVGMLVTALAALIAFMVIVARTGNEPGVGVSGIEMKFRSLLDRTLPVRPRTKEFLIGHPAFVLALALWWRGRRKWAVPLFVVGVIGQVSILNTFSHIHTPLYLSLIRDISGLVLGTLIGLAVFFATEVVFKPRRQHSAEPAAGP
jgi:hypothetical protein